MSKQKKLPFAKEDIIQDYRTAMRSRTASLIGRKEVLTGKAKFGIFGDGKEIPQLAMARAFQPGDIRSGYYRDQTFMFAAEMSNVREFFAQLYADTDEGVEPASAGRQMNGHFATRMLDADGQWKTQKSARNSSADISPTGGQMARSLGLAYASKLYRKEPGLAKLKQEFSNNGNEVAFVTIGNASTSEGVFFETVNAAGVLQVPLAIFIWDDGYGISVPNEYQTTKCSISEVLKGFQRDEKGNGFDIYVTKGWDYAALCETFTKGIEKVRKEHVPAIFHVTELTQPQGHSTSGSHERYKSKERLAWEEENCCLKRMREWMISEKIASASELEAWEAEDRKFVEAERKAAWDHYMEPIIEEREKVLRLLDDLKQHSSQEQALTALSDGLKKVITLNRKAVQSTLSKSLVATRGETSSAHEALKNFYKEYKKKNFERFCSHLYSQGKDSPLFVTPVEAKYAADAEVVDGRMVLQKCFEHHLQSNPSVFAIGEDVGRIGDVNQAFQGLQAAFGELRVTDTGIREATILGQGLGAAMRGLRPIIEIQYLDYLLYALQTMSDDLATVHYRSKGGQKSPLVIRTRGHRLEGVWHAGSPMGMIVHSCRGIYVCVPRNMTQAAGFYNTLLQGDNPALIVEVLSGYRLKETVPENVGEFRVPLGVPEVIREGKDVTIVTYGACCRVANEAADELARMGIHVEIVDVQTLIPFDLNHKILDSIKKTNAVLFFDEDVPGGASAYMMQKVLEEQRAYDWLDCTPRTLSAQENRPAYGTDGDYFCKPNVEDVVDVVYAMMRERFPSQFPALL